MYNNNNNNNNVNNNNNNNIKISKFPKFRTLEISGWGVCGGGRYLWVVVGWRRYNSAYHAVYNAVCAGAFWGLLRYTLGYIFLFSEYWVY